MKRTFRALALALALSAVPACASIFPPTHQVGAERTLNQRAYTLISAYAAALEEAADIVRDPATPAEVRRALAQAEAAATPAIEALHQALAIYSADDQRLSAAFANAQAPVDALIAITAAH